MGIYIKGMNLPSECTDCSFGYQSIYCKAMPSLSPEWEIDGVKPDWCPLTEVEEPHGRLIDADALAKDVTENALHDPNNFDWIEVSSVIALIAMNAVIERSENDV